MAKIKVKTNLPAAEPPCPPPVPNAAPKTMMVPTDPPRMPLPPPPFLPGACCCPGTTQVVDNVTVISLTPDTLEVTEGTVGGMKAFALSSSLSNEHITVEGGENVEVDREQVDNEVTYTVNAIIPETEHVTVKAGENTTVDREQIDNEVTYTVNASDPKVYIDDDCKEFIYGDGTKDNPLGINDFEGASENNDGISGAVPAPLTGEHDKYLKGDGTWAEADAELDETSNRPVSNRAVTRALKNFGGFTKVDGTGPNHEPDVENPSSKIIYLVTVNDSPDPDHSIEWIWNEDNESWECIGTTSIQYGLVIVNETGEVSGTSMTVFVANDTYTKFEVPATVKTLVVEMGTVAVTGPVSNSMFEFTLPSDTALETVVVVDGDGIDKTALAPMSWPGTVTYQGRITNGIANIIGYSQVIYNGQWLSTNNGQIITTSTGKHIKYAI